MTREARTGDHLLAHDLREDKPRRVQRSIMTCLRRACGEPVSALPILRTALRTGAVIRADTGTVFEGETAAAMQRKEAEAERIAVELKVQEAANETARLSAAVTSRPIPEAQPCPLHVP